MRALTALLLLFVAALGFSAEHEINLYISRDIAPGPKIQVQVNTKNTPGVTMAAYKIDAVDWLKNPDEDRFPKLKGTLVKQWQTAVASKGQRPYPKPQDTYYSRQINLPMLEPGVYLLTASGNGVTARQVVNITNLAVVTKRSPKRMLVWVTHSLKGHVIPKAKVMLYRDGKLTKTMATGADGVVMTEEAPGSHTVVIQHGKDFAALPSEGIDPDGKLVSHIQTDRPIYRPGQKVSYKAVLRRTLGQGYRTLVNQSVEVTIRDPKDILLDRKQLTTNGFGSIAGDFSVPSEGMTGPYSIVMKVGEDTTYTTFTVSEYRKPEFKVAGRALANRYLSGEEIRFEVVADYYFGAPVQQAEVNYIVRRRPMSFWGGSSEDEWFYSGDGNLYSRDTYQSDGVVAQDRGYTDANGKLVIAVKTDPNLGDHHYTIQFVVTDSSRRQVEGSASVPVYGSLLRVGLRSDMQYVALGRLIPLEIRVNDLDGKPSAGQVYVEVSQPVFNQKTGNYDFKKLADTTVNVPSTGRAAANLPAKAQGDLRIRASVKDRTGRVAKTEMYMWVAGPFVDPAKQEEYPELSIRLDKRSYEPGEKVSSYTTTNKPGRPLLLVIEGEDIWAYQVRTDKKAGQTWQFTATRAMSPNAFLSGSQWHEGDYISGTTLIPIPDKTRQISVAVTPDKSEYKPGEKASYTVKTTDSTGKPVSAEVAVSVVDEAIYALMADVTADPYRVFWGRRENKVVTHNAAPQEVSGGAYQQVSTVAPVRQRFEDTAYWNAFVTTGADGSAKVEFEMPGNLTTWRTTARGFTADTRAGSARSSVVATRPVTLRLATPRQMVQGDRLTLIATVNNRTDEQHEFEVRLVAEGMPVENAPKQRVVVEGKSSATVEWVLLASELRTATLTAEVVPLDVQGPGQADFADALRVPVRVVPDGVQERKAVGDVMVGSKELSLMLPTDRIEPATVASVKVFAGVSPVLRSAQTEILTQPRYNSTMAAAQLEVAALRGLTNEEKEVIEAIAMLSRTQTHDGWGYWEGRPSDVYITAAVAKALAIADKSASINVPDVMMESAHSALRTHFNRTNLWEQRALLASTMVELDPKAGGEMMQEVLSRGQNLSPYAKAQMIGALVTLGNTERAHALADEILKDVSDGSGLAFLPIGYGVGWRASTFATTAALLEVLVRAKSHEDLQPKLLRWLMSEREWLSVPDKIAMVRALHAYVSSRPDATALGHLTVKLNGQDLQVPQPDVNGVVTIPLPQTLLSDQNAISLQRDAGGEAFVDVEARYYLPKKTENQTGIRVVRRFEVQNPAGAWVELDRPVRANEPVRCTVTVWGDSVEDEIKVVEPLPAGFEFMDEDYTGYSRQEVRDGAVVHYVIAGGNPVFFRYFMRAESEGVLTALPATAEVLRRPSVRGQSSEVKVTVVDPKKGG